MTLSRQESESQPEAAETPLSLIDFLTANSGQRIQSIVFINNVPTDRFHIRLISETGNDDSFKEDAFISALGWFEQRMQELTPTKEEMRIAEPGTEWQLRQIQRLRQKRRISATNILHRRTSAADILQMTEIAAVLGGIKNKLPQDLYR